VLGLVFLLGLSGLMVPAVMVIREQRRTAQFIPTECSSNIINIVSREFSASVLTTEAGTGHLVRLVYPPLPGIKLPFRHYNKDWGLSAWLARISAGSPRATFRCLVDRRPSGDRVAVGITNVAQVAEWYVAAVVAGIAILLLVMIVGGACFYKVQGCTLHGPPAPLAPLAPPAQLDGLADQQMIYIGPYGQGGHTSQFL